MTTEIEKTPAELRQAQRDAIASTTVEKEKEGETEGGDDTEEASEEAGAETGKEAAETGSEDDKGGKEGEAESGEGTEEVLTAKDIEKLKKTITRLQKRVDKTTAEKAATARELADAKAALAAKPDDEKVLTEADVEIRAEQKASQKQLERDFANSCDRLYEAATKTDKDFKKKVDMMAEDAGLIPGSMIGILDELDNGGDVLSYLTNNIEDYEEIRELSPAKMSIKLAKLSNKIEAEKKPKPKPISNAPNPMENLGGKSAGSTTVITGKEDMNEFARKRALQIEQRRKEKAAGYR